MPSRGEATYRVVRVGGDIVGSWQDDAAPPRALAPMFAAQFERLGELDGRLAVAFADALAESLLRGHAEIPGFATANRQEGATLLGWSSEEAALAASPAVLLPEPAPRVEADTEADQFWPLWYPTLAECASAPLRAMPILLEASPDPRQIVADIGARDQLPPSRIERELNDCLERRVRRCSEARGASDDVDQALARLTFAVTRLAPYAGARA